MTPTIAEHQRQKVGAMKLPAIAGKPSEEKAAGFRPGGFDCSGCCGHAGDAGNEIRLRCGVDCRDSGINVALSNGGKSAMMPLQHVPIRDRDKAGGEAEDALQAGADDSIFTVVRAEVQEFANL